MYFKKNSNAVPYPLLKWILCGIAFFMLTALCNSSYGQINYYFQYKLTAANKKLTEYDMLFTINMGMIRNANARIAFVDPLTGKKRLVKLNYIDNDFPDNSDTEKITYYMPFGNAFDENDNPVKDFIMPWFRFDKPVSYNMQNAVVKAYTNKQVSPLPGSYQEKIPSDNATDRAFLSRFYTAKELSQYISPPLRANERGRDLYMIAIGATDDPEIGATTQIDLENMQSMISNGGPQLGVNFKYIEISGKNFTKKAVNDAINSIKPSSKDIVIVYYSGHGFRYTDDVSPYPRMALVPSPDKNPDTDNISVEEVYNRVLKKGANVTIVLADCCNENYGAAPPVGKIQPFVEAAPGSPRLNTDNWRALFLPKHRMSILACAADKNQLAGGNGHLGGFFTNYTVNEVLTSLYGWSGESSWAMIINNSKEYTRRQAQTIECKQGACDVNGRNIQTPELKLVSNNK